MKKKTNANQQVPRAKVGKLPSFPQLKSKKFYAQLIQDPIKALLDTRSGIARSYYNAYIS